MINVTLRQLRYFDALARHGHFGRAAEACAISQPALSMQIKEMEEALGGLLLERSARQVALTRFGEELAQRVRDILRSVDELGDFARASRDRLAGRLRIGMIPTIAPYLLPKIIGNLTRLHPELDIQVRETLTPKLIQELAEGRLDTAIVALPVSEPSFTEVALFSENFLLVRPAQGRGNTGAEPRDAARNEAATAGRGTLFPRPGSVVLQDAIVAATGDAGCELAVDTRSNGERRHRRHPDPGNGRAGGNTLGLRVGRPLQEPAALANHRHGLAQDQSSRETTPANLRSGLSSLSRGDKAQRAIHEAPGGETASPCVTCAANA